MAAVRTDDAIDELRMEMTAVKAPLTFEPRTTALVYLPGSLAAMPYTQFW